MRTKLVQCIYTIEKRFKGQRYVYSRNRCQRWVRCVGETRCWQHRSPVSSVSTWRENWPVVPR